MVVGFVGTVLLIIVIVIVLAIVGAFTVIRKVL
jgi:hypothetical protein